MTGTSVGRLVQAGGRTYPNMAIAVFLYTESLYQCRVVFRGMVFPFFQFPIIIYKQTLFRTNPYPFFRVAVEDVD